MSIGPYSWAVIQVQLQNSFEFWNMLPLGWNPRPSDPHIVLNKNPSHKPEYFLDFEITKRERYQQWRGYFDSKSDGAKEEWWSKRVRSVESAISIFFSSKTEKISTHSQHIFLFLSLSLSLSNLFLCFDQIQLLSLLIQKIISLIFVEHLSHP